MKHLLFWIIVACIAPPAFTQTWEATIINMDKRYGRAVEISSIVIKDGFVYLPSPKCDSIYIDRIDGNALRISKALPLGECDFEGASYINGNFYFSDDRTNAIVKYDLEFKTSPTTYQIKLDGNEGVDGNNGFEGIAAINETTFYLLLEKNEAKTHSILYKATLKDNYIIIESKRLLPVDANTRYCDLFYKDSVLYLLKTSYYGSNCDPRNKYDICSLALDKDMNIGQTEPKTYLSLTKEVRARCGSFNTNIEGIGMDEHGCIYVVSDNCYNEKRACSDEGEYKTFLLRFQSKGTVKNDLPAPVMGITQIPGASQGTKPGGNSKTVSVVPTTLWTRKSWRLPPQFQITSVKWKKDTAGKPFIEITGNETGSARNANRKFSWQWTPVTKKIFRDCTITNRTLKLNDDDAYRVVAKKRTLISDGDVGSDSVMIDEVEQRKPIQQKIFEEGLENKAGISSQELREDHDFSRQQHVALYDKYRFSNNKVQISFGISYGIARAHRSIGVAEFQPADNANLEHRRRSELSTVGHTAAFTIGLRVTPKSSITFDLLRLVQGFRSEAIDWYTGNPAYTAGPKKDNLADSWGFGIGYCYAPYNGLFSSVFDLGVYNTWLNSWDAGQRSHTWGGKLGWGVAFRPDYWLEFRLIPAIHYNFKAISKGDLSTNLYNVGVNAGIVVRP